MIALFFDTETTGIKSDDQPDFKPALVQLGAVLQDLESGKILAELNLIANLYPGVTIPAEATAVHGITDAMTVTFGVDPKLIDITFGKLVKMADVVVAHNLDYDLDVVRDNMPLTHSVIDFKHHFCTMETNVEIIKLPHSERVNLYHTSKGDKPLLPFKYPSLMETYKFYFNDEYDDAHDAMADVRACRDVFLMMIEHEWFRIGPDPEFQKNTIMPTAKYEAATTTDAT